MHLFNHSKEHDIILNIGSGGVSGAVVDLNSSLDSKPKIAHTFESIFPLKSGASDPTASELTTFMLAALHKVVASLAKEHKRNIKVVHVVFASPWFSPFSKNLSIKKDEPFVVNEKTIEKLIGDEVVGHIKKAPANGETVIEKTISHIKLNGYATANPYEKMAKNIDVSVYASRVPTKIQTDIESEIHKVIHPKSVAYHTLPFVAWNSIVSIFSPAEDFLFIDIGSEVSDVVVAKKGAISSLVSFPVGINHFARKASVYFETTAELADSIINLYATDSAEASLRDKTQKLVEAFGEEWNIRFQQALKDSDKEGNADHFLPQKVYLASKQNYSAIFGRMLSKQIANTTILNKEALSQFIEFGINETPNIFIALETIYLNSLINSHKSVYKEA